MRRIAMVLLLALAGCVHTQQGGSKPDLHEAARINTQLGIDYMRSGRLDLAREKLERAVQEDPDYAVAQSSLAFLYSRQGKTAKAEARYRRALALDSNNPDTLNNFGVFLCGQGKTAEAERYFLDAARDKNFATPEAAWTNAGVCVRRKEPDKAERYFREALKRNPEFPDALAQMALISFERKDYLRARAFLQRYEQVGRPTPDTLRLAAQTERALGDAGAAARYEQRLRTEFPEANPGSDPTPARQDKRP